MLCVFIHYIYITKVISKYVCNHTFRGIILFLFIFFACAFELVFVFVLSVKCRRYSTGGLAFAKNKDLISSNQLIESLSLSSYIRYVLYVYVSRIDAHQTCAFCLCMPLHT